MEMKISTMKSTMLGSALSVCFLAANAQGEASGKPLKVYILAGQSNATGMVATQTLEHLKMFPDTHQAFAGMFDPDGKPIVLDDVYVSQWMDKEGGKLAPRYGGGSKGTMFGPEYPFGISMHEKLNEPILIIKTSQGGRSLNYHFRSPSAGEWMPPAGHPDLEEEVVKILPIPEKLDLPADFMNSEGQAAGVASRRTGKYLGLSGMRGVKLDEVNGVHPIALAFRAGREERVPGRAFQGGDLILGLNGAGLGEDAIEQWRKAYWEARSVDGDWMLNVTLWRNGEIKTFDFDIAETLDGGREALPQHLATMKEQAIEKEAQRGEYYRMMIRHVKEVLGDLGNVHPAYDESAGHEIAGFVWFQGYNDLVSGGTYPNRDKPGGYDQYTWLLEHFIRDVRKDLNAPELPFVIGVLGVGGDEDPPTSNLGYFQQAQAAVAKNPEFQDTVVNVRTGQYWDPELIALIENTGSCERLSNGDWAKVTDPEGKPVWTEQPSYEDYRSYVLKRAISDQGYHYFGSAKIMSGIGKGFAEAMIQLKSQE